MGFDEINILSNPDTGSGGAGASVGGGSGLGDMQPLEYDFLSGLDTSKADKIYKQMKDMLSPIKDIWEYLNDYEDTIKTIIALIVGTKIIKSIKKIGTALVGLKFVEYFKTGFQTSRLLGNGFFKSVNTGITDVRNNLTGIQKAGIVAVSGLLGFVTIKDSVKALALGCEDVGAKITTITVALGLMGTAMYVALGPWGLLVAGAVGLVAAIVGVISAHDEMREKMLDELIAETLYGGTGAKISDLADKFGSLMDAIIKTNQPILDNRDVIKEAQTSMDDTVISIGNIITAYDRGIISTEEFVIQISEKMATLNNNVKTAMDATYNNIIYALSTSLGDAIEDAGGSVEEYLRIIGKIKDEGTAKFNDLLEKQKELDAQFAAGTITQEEYTAQMLEVITQMQALGGASSTVDIFSDKINSLKDTVKNWESEEARDNFFDSVNEDARKAKEEVNASADEMKRSLENLLLWTDDQESIDLINELIVLNEESRKNQLAEIDTAVNEMYDGLQTSMLVKLDELTEAAATKWETMTEKERKLWDNDKSKYLADAMGKYWTDAIEPTAELIQNSMDQLGTDGSVWISGSIDEMMHAMDRSMNSGTNKHFSKWMKELKFKMETLGVDGVAGYLKGAKSGDADVAETFGDLAEEGIKAVEDTQDSHSPAKEYIKLAKYAVDGYVKGITDNFQTIYDTFSTSFGKMFDNLKVFIVEKIATVSKSLSGFSTDGLNNSLDSVTKKAETVFKKAVWEGFANNVTNALAKIKMPTFKNMSISVSFSTNVSADRKKVYQALGLSGWPYLSWYTYASGGFPQMGEMFIAREAGPELVGSIGRKTAVANNDQIVSGIESGVYRAMVAANSTNNTGSTQTIRIINEIDGDIVGEKVIQYHNGKVMQTGVSPLLV